MKQLTTSILLVFILSLFGIAAVALAQSQDGADTPPPQDTAAPTLPDVSNVEKKPDSPETYDINYLYDPGNRRDPFISLLTGIKKTSNVPSGQLTVADAKVVGITGAKDASGRLVYTAIIMGSDKKARFAKPGFKLYDGEVIAVEVDRVVFRQDLTEDTLAAPGLKSKEVVKRLHPVQEGT